MKIVVACGGTGGHTFPGLAVAEELVKRGHDVTVWTSGRSIESSVMQRWTGKVFATGAKQLSAKNVFAILRSIFRCRAEMKREKPAALIAMGSYSSLPPVLAARSCGVKVFLHEANTVPGKAVEFLSRFADTVAISFEMTARYLKGVKTVVTGLPVRADIASGTRFDFIPREAFTVFVTGGSQGAHRVNELMRDALVLLHKDLTSKPSILGTPGQPSTPSTPSTSGTPGQPCTPSLYVIHQTGAADEASVQAAYAAAAIPSRVHAFEREMANAFASADLVVARAGASTCFELAACGKPVLFIPLPSAMRDHQHYNAEAFAAKGAADEGFQDKLTPRSLARYLNNIINDRMRLEKMSEKMRALSTPDAARRVADLIVSDMVG